MKSVLVLAVASGLFEVSQAQSPMKNIGYLGSGYDVFSGDLWGDGTDSGLKLPIYEFSYAGGRLTPDQRFLLPDGVQAAQDVSCSYSSTSMETFTSKDYKTDVTQDISAGFTLPKASFTASSHFEHVHEQISSRDLKVVHTKARCSNYQASFLPYTNLTVTPTFAKAVALLDPTDESKTMPTYFEFIKNFGTHYIKQIEMGAKCIISSAFDQEKFKLMDQTDRKVAASASFLVFTGSTSTDSEKSLAEEYDTTRESSEQYFLGAPPSTDGSWQTWAQNSGESPFPIQYVIGQWEDILTKDNFPYDKNLTVKVEKLNKAMNIYCGTYKNCINPSIFGWTSAGSDDGKASSGRHITKSVYELEPSYKMLGGGAEGRRLECKSNGQYIFSSFPLDVRRWQVESAEHAYSDNKKRCKGSSSAFVGAINDPDNEFETEYFSMSCRGEGTIHCEVALPSGWVRVGGGAQAIYGEGYAFLTGNYPCNSSSWCAQAKQTKGGSSSSITVYAVGLRFSNKTTDGIKVAVTNSTSEPGTKPSQSVLVEKGYTLVGGGALIANVKGGSKHVLGSSKPYSEDAWGASSEDISESNKLASVTAFAIGLQIFGYPI